MNGMVPPAVVIVFLALFVYAFVRAARGQRASKRALFRNLAHARGLRYVPEDDGPAKRFALDLDGIEQFRFPSPGKNRTAHDVVTGELDGRPVILFRCMTRFYEGDAREWFVAGVTAEATIAERCSVEFFEGSRGPGSRYLRDPVVLNKTAESFCLVVRAASTESAGRFLTEDSLQWLVEEARNLTFRPEIQIRADRVAVYPADRNTSVEAVGDLEKLLEFALRVAREAVLARDETVLCGD